MIDSELLNKKDFVFDVFNKNLNGDSGTLYIATSKEDNTLQYIVKSNSAEIACNEFMYHHIANTLGLYTQETRLFKAGIGEPSSVGIRYVENPHKYSLESSNEENKRIFFAFETLFVILNEEDSHEYYYDKQGHLFKLDNAASFNLADYLVLMILQSAQSDDVKKIVERSLTFTEYEKYAALLEVHLKLYGQSAVDMSLETFKAFSELDISLLEGAFETLKIVYNSSIVNYFKEFIRIRIETCKRFLMDRCGYQ